MELSTIQNKIYEIRGCRVMLDFDLAEMYQVETRILNQSVKRNTKRFPSDFMFQLSQEEWENLKSQIVMSSKNEDNSSQIVMSSNRKHRGGKYVPFAFTEQGIAMLSGLLNSDIAIAVNINIMRAFVAVRHFLANPPTNEVKEPQNEMKELKKYIEEVFADYNDMHEDTRMQIDLINETLAELQAQNKLINKPRKPIGYIKPKENND
jgi:ORF6N domain.